jgi:glutaredoxin
MKKVKEVTVFSTTWCPYCKMVEEWLNQKKVSYKTVMIDEDQNAAMYIIEKSGQRGVPVTEVKFDDDSANYVVGYDRNTLSELLK